MRKTLIQSATKYIGSFILMLCVFVALLSASNVLFDNKEKMLEHIKESYVTISQEGVYPEYNGNGKWIGQDNFADSIILNIAYYLDKETNLYSIMNMKYVMVNDGEFNAMDDLQYISTTDNVTYVGYPRYWHGYMVYIKPLLNYLNYSQIRMVLFVVLYTLVIILLFRVWKIVGWKASLAYLAGFFMINVNRLWMTIEYINIFFVIMIFLIIYTYIKKDKLWDSFMWLNFILGGCVCFVDFLTVPLASIGLSISYFLLIYCHDKDKTIGKVLKKCIGTVFTWGIGYAIVWISKWVLASLILKINVIQDAVSMTEYRTTAVPDGFTKNDWIKYDFQGNLRYLFEGKFKIEIVAIIVVLLVIALVKYHKNFVEWSCYVLFTVLAISPYAWYLLVNNHSGIHSFFTYRCQIVTVVSIVIMVLYSIDFEKMLNNKEEKDEQ